MRGHGRFLQTWSHIKIFSSHGKTSLERKWVQGFFQDFGQEGSK